MDAERKKAPDYCPKRYWIKNDRSSGAVEPLDDSKPRCLAFKLEKICRPGQVAHNGCPDIRKK
jgi:hypothetical protein